MPDIAVREVRSAGGIAFWHAGTTGRDAVCLHVAWPSDWAYRDDAVGAPLVGARLLLSGGAGQRDAAALERDFEDLGATAVFDVEADHVRGSLASSLVSIGAAVDIGSDVLARAVLDPARFELVRDGLAADLERDGLASMRLLQRLSLRSRLGDVALARALVPIPDEIRAVTLDDVRRWYAHAFRADGATVAVVGDAGEREAGELVDRLLGDLDPGGPSRSAKVEPADAPGTHVVHGAAESSARVILTGTLPSEADGGDFDDLIAVKILGQGDGSRLHEALRIRLRASYAPSAEIVPRTLAWQDLVMSTEAGPDQSEQVREAMRSAYARFVDEGPLPEEVAALVERLWPLYSEALGSTPSLLARTIVGVVISGDRPTSAAGLLEGFGSVDASSVAERMRNRWPTATDFVEVVRTPDGTVVS